MSCVRSRLSFFPCQEKKRRLAICCVPIPAWVEIAISAFSSVVRLSDFVGSLWDCAFFTGDSDGVTKGTRRTGDERTEPAAGRECAFAQSHRPCHAFRREYVGGCAPPNLRQRAIGSLDSLHLIRGKVPFCAITSALPCFPRGVRWGSAPQTAPRRPVSLDSLHLIRGVGTLYAMKGFRVNRALRSIAIPSIPEPSPPRPATPGYTKRPARLQ